MSLYVNALAKTEDILMQIASVSFITIMLLMSADVFMRYVMNSPISWLYEALTKYLVYASFFFSVSFTLRKGEHLHVEVISNRIPRRPRGLILGVLYLPISFLIGLAAWKAIQSTVKSYHANELLAGVVHWPIWTSKAIVAIGLTVLTLRCVEMTRLMLAEAACSGQTVAVSSRNGDGQ